MERCTHWKTLVLAIVLGVGLSALAVGVIQAQTPPPTAVYGYYVYTPTEVLVIGHPAEIDAALLAFTLQLTRTSRISLTWLAAVSVTLFTDTQNLALDFYVPVTATAENASKLLARWFEVSAVQAYAHPNHLVEGAPYGVEGSPWMQGDDVLFAPATGLQWAERIELLRNGMRVVTETGAGARVIVVDNACSDMGPHPFPEGVSYAVLPHGPISATLNPFNRAPVACHGEQVAWLAHTVAPEAEIVIQPVLNAYGWAQLSDVLLGLDQLVLATRDVANGRLDSAIFNFSWGIRTLPANTLPSGIASLFTLLEGMHELGATLVAAAGNGSSGVQYPADAPANFPFVLSVAATDSRNYAPACYTNPTAGVGVAAPGGNGVMGYTTTYTTPVCQPQMASCDAGRCMVSFDPDSAHGSRYVMGTSFAAPLVSGLAALLLEQNPDWMPVDITQQITFTTTPGTGDNVRGKGVINVCRALGYTVCQHSVWTVSKPAAGTTAPIAFDYAGVVVQFVEPVGIEVMTVTVAAGVWPTNNPEDNVVRRAIHIEAWPPLTGFNATLHICYDESELGGLDEEHLQLYRWNGSAWVGYATAVDSTENCVVAAGVSEFSPWLIGALDNAPSSVTIQQVRTAYWDWAPLIGLLLVAATVARASGLRKPQASRLVAQRENKGV
jgi:hypothetical protein